MNDKNEDMYYRPEWTCGRYDSKHRVAIIYNLIEGMSYFFEDYSAMVLGEVLSVKRNGIVTVESVSEHTNIGEASIKTFFEKLTSLNLLTQSIPTAHEIQEYRSQVSKFKLSQSHDFVKVGKENAKTESTAEMSYISRVDGITTVLFELTYNCSEKCIHCYNIGATRNDNEVSRRGELEELTLQDYKRIIDELYEQGLIKVRLSGGDPFSKSFVWDIISYLYEKDIAFEVFTNGLRIVKDIDRLVNYYPCLVGVSIYSGMAEVHDRITRTKGSWEKSISVIKQLSEHAVPTEIKCCVMQPNAKSYYMIADIAKQYGAVAQFELSVTDSVDGDRCVSKYLRLSPEQLEIVLQDKNTPLYVGKDVANYGGSHPNMDNNACSAGYGNFCITPDGKLIPCCAFHMVLGDLKKQSVGDILKGSEQLKWWKGLTLKQYEDCGKHDYCDYCNFCAGINYSEWGTPLKAGENNCYLAKVRYKLVEKLKKGEALLKDGNLLDALADLQEYTPNTLQRIFV